MRWHDGVPVTAHDVKFTFKLFDAMWGTTRGTGVTVHDDATLTIRFARPTDALDWWMVYYPRHLLERLDPAEFDDWEFWRRSVGNGPYHYVRHVPRPMVEVAASPDYYGGKPRIGTRIARSGAAQQAHAPAAPLRVAQVMRVALGGPDCRLAQLDEPDVMEGAPS